MPKRFKVGVPILVAMTLAVSGCSLGSSNSLKETDAPPITYVEEGESLENIDQEPKQEEVATEETVMRELYLLDQNGYVVPQVLQVPKAEGVAKQALEYLVNDGPVSQLLPNGFQAVLPAGTEIYGVSLDNGVAVVDFSEQFKDYQPENELKILQAITWTLTQFESINAVKIQINGHVQEVMPVNGTPIGEGFSRANGINLETENVVDITNSKAVTVYFLAQAGENPYYVPVTRRVHSEVDQLQAAVHELIEGPSSFSNLLSDFRHGVKLLDEPNYSNGIVTVNFNEALLNHLEGTAVSEEVLNLIVLSLTEQQGVEQVAIEVNGESEILTASGEQLTKPVARPLQVNTGKY